MERFSYSIFQDKIKDEEDKHKVLEVDITFNNLPILFILYLILKCMVQNLSIYIYIYLYDSWLWRFVQKFGSTVVNHKAMYVWRSSEALSCDNCCSIKAVLHILSMRLWPQLPSMQSAYTVLDWHLWPVWLFFFSNYFTKSPIFKKKQNTEKCVFWFSVQSFMKYFYSKNNLTRYYYKYKNIGQSSSKVPVIVSDFDRASILSTDFQEINKYQTEWKSVH